MQLSVLSVHSLKLVARHLILHMNYHYDEFLPNMVVKCLKGDVCGILCASDYMSHWLCMGWQENHSSCFGTWFVACALLLDIVSIHCFLCLTNHCSSGRHACMCQVPLFILIWWIVQAVLGATYSTVLPVAFYVICLTVQSFDSCCFAFLLICFVWAIF